MVAEAPEFNAERYHLSIGTRLFHVSCRAFLGGTPMWGPAFGRTSEGRLGGRSRTRARTGGADSPLGSGLTRKKLGDRTRDERGIRRVHRVVDSGQLCLV